MGRPTTTLGSSVVRLDRVTKRFSGSEALHDVSLDVRRGEVHALFGENGAGKSTIANLIAGSFQPDSGSLLLDEKIVRLRSPHHARTMGVRAVFQQLSLVPSMTVAENIYLGQEIVHRNIRRKDEMLERSAALIHSLGFEVDPSAEVNDLSRAEQQATEIAKAIQGAPVILILDEATAALGDAESEALIQKVTELRDDGLAILYISHRVDEIHRLADRVTVLRDGNVVASMTAGEFEVTDHIGLIATSAVRRRQGGKVGPRAGEGLRLEAVHSSRLRDVSIQVSGGEIVGVAGLIGSGKDAIGRVVLGMEALQSGSICIDGEIIRRPDPSRMIESGILYLPADRLRDGLVSNRPARENLSLHALRLPRLSRGAMLQRRKEIAVCEVAASRLHLRPANVEMRIDAFSGGNQQKVLVGRSLVSEPVCLIADEPTTGVDVGSRAELYSHFEAAAARGAAVLVISSDLDELSRLCSRVYVMHGGRVVREFWGDEVTSKSALAALLGEA